MARLKRTSFSIALMCGWTLIAAAPGYAQESDQYNPLLQRIAKAEQELNAKATGCEPIDLKPYSDIVDEAEAIMKTFFETRQTDAPLLKRADVQKLSDAASHLWNGAFVIWKKHAECAQASVDRPAVVPEDGTRTDVPTPQIRPKEVFGPTNRYSSTPPPGEPSRLEDLAKSLRARLIKASRELSSKLGSCEPRDDLKPYEDLVEEARNLKDLYDKAVKDFLGTVPTLEMMSTSSTSWPTTFRLISSTLVKIA